MTQPESFGKSIVSKLIIINVIVFFAQMLFQGYQVVETIMFHGQAIPLQRSVPVYYFAITPLLVLKKFYFWQVFTYMFLHGGTMHIFFNMFMLFMFGAPLELAWGSKKFLIYYLFCGVGGGISILILNSFLGGASYIIPTLGASGAVFGLFFAFGRLFPDTELRFFPLFFIAIKAKYAVILFGGLELLFLIGSGGASPISHVGHLGGLLFGILYFVYNRKHNIKFKSKMFTAQVSKNLAHKDEIKQSQVIDNQTFLMGVLTKIKDIGINSLSDDEFQRLRYIQIMHGDNYNNTDESQILKKIKKYI